MTPQELLIPRVEVIANYPNSPFKVGQIIQYSPVGYAFPVDELTGIHNTIPTVDIETCPAIFKPCKWWEKRKIEDMPEYIKGMESGKVIRCEWETPAVVHDADGDWTRRFEKKRLDYHTPATREDYEAYLKTK